MKRSLLPIATLLSLAACNGANDALAPTSETNQPPSTTGPALIASGFGRMALAGRSDSVTALIVAIDSSNGSHKDAKIKVGDKDLETKDGKFLLPIPDLSNFCGAKITFTITTTTGTFNDTLSIKGNACGDSTMHPAIPSADSSIVFTFQDTGAVFHDLTGKRAATVNGATWGKDASGFYVHASGLSTVDFGNLIKDGSPEGSVELVFRPDPNFGSLTARTIFGNNGSRCLIGWVKGQIFFQKGWDNIHRWIASDTGMLLDNKWHKIQATWGSQGMTLSIDSQLVAWSNDISLYQSAPAGYGNDLMIGGKSACCLEPMQISQYSPNLTAAGSYRYLRISSKQPRIWQDNEPHASKSIPGLTVAPSGTTAPSYVTFPIW